MLGNRLRSETKVPCFTSNQPPTISKFPYFQGKNGGVGWFSYQRLSILHPSCRRVCGGGPKKQDLYAGHSGHAWATGFWLGLWNRF